METEDDNANDAIQNLDVLISGDDNRTVEILKTLCTNKDETFFSLYTDRLVSIIAKRMHDTLAVETISMRLMKYLLNALHVICTNPTHAKLISSPTLQQLLPELIQASLDQKLSAMDADVSRALGLLLVKTLENTDKVEIR